MHHKSLSRPADYSIILYILLSVTAILSGGIIYIFLRPAGSLFSHWISAAGFDCRFRPAGPVAEWIVFSLPGGLWAFAYALLITGIWSGSATRIRYLWMVSIPLLVMGFELLQLTGIIPGTFCMQDIASGAAGMILGMIVAHITVKPENHESTID